MYLPQVPHTGNFNYHTSVNSGAVVVFPSPRRLLINEFLLHVGCDVSSVGPYWPFSFWPWEPLKHSWLKSFEHYIDFEFITLNVLMKEVTFF